MKDFSTDLSLEDLKAFMGSHDARIAFRNSDPKLLAFFSNEIVIQKLIQIVFTEENSSISDFKDALSLRCTPFFKIIIKSETFSQFFYRAIRVVSMSPETCTVDRLNKIRGVLPRILAFLRNTELQNSTFYQYALEMFDILVHNFNSTNLYFLYDFLNSGIPSFTLTEEDFESIIFKDQKINSAAIPLLSLLNSGIKLQFNFSNYIHDHFISFLLYALLRDTPLFDSMKILEILSAEIENSRKDKVVKGIVCQFYDNAHPYIKSQIIKRFHILPTDFVKVLFDPETNNHVAKSILDLMISKNVLRQNVADFVNDKTLQDFPETFPFIVTIFEKLPDLRPMKFNEYLQQYNGRVIVPEQKRPTPTPFRFN